MPDPAVIAVVAALIVAVWILRSSWLTGAIGELRVNRSLRTLLDESEYQLFSDLMLPAPDGTTQVDHIIVSRFGVFVIETKNMKGWIFGNEDQPQWTQVIYRKKSQFKNPIRQNYKHVKAVQELLGIPTYKLHNVVAFVGSATPKSATPAGVVWGILSLAEYIKSKRVAVLNKDELRTFAENLGNKDFQSTILTRNAHVRHVKTQGHLGSARCPRCGATMVERTNRRSGSKFLACPRYPSCKGTRKLR